MEVLEVVGMELKYCERCGGLLLRPLDSGVTYCSGCSVKIAELPRGKASRGKTNIQPAEVEEIEARSAACGLMAVGEGRRS